LKKAAKYYRMAEKQGVKSVGQSWIWKDKYDDDEDSVDKRRNSAPTDKTSVQGNPKKGRELFRHNT
jgi:hypothetical protein